MVHLKKKENFIIARLRKYVFLRHPKYSGDLINYKMTTNRYLAAKGLCRHQ